MRKNKKRVKRTSKSKVAKFLRGSTTITLILLVIIVGAVLMVGGIFPKGPEVKSDVTEGVPDTNSLVNSDKNSLQLATLKFKPCSEQITVDLLLDRTGSMSRTTPTGETKISRLKEAVITLTNKLSDNSIIGIQTFSSKSITDDVPISYYKDVKGTIDTKINAMKAEGGTPTHDGLAFSLNKLRDALPRYPERKFSFIFISDGQPDPASQDPRLFNPNPATEIKNLGVNVFTLGIYDTGQAVDTKMRDLLISIATKPENYFEAKTGDDVTKLLNSISNKICEATSPSPIVATSSANL